MAALNQIEGSETRIGEGALIYPGQRLILPATSSEIGPQVDTEAAAESLETAQFIWPVEGRIVKHFRVGHRAIDIAVPTGSSVLAAAGGSVEYAGWISDGYGKLIIVDHGNGWRTLYAHNSELQVSSGQDVAQGDVLALSGSTGNSTMPHVHLEMVRDLVGQDPCQQLPGGC